MDSKLKNFLKVVTTSASGGIKLTTLGFGLGFSLILPEISLVFVSLALASVGVLIFTDVTNPKFIQKTLQTKTAPNKNLSQTLDGQLTLLRNQLRLGHHLEVAVDLEEVMKNLHNTKKLIDSMDLNEQASIAFVAQFVPKIVEKVIKLARQEQTAREYLEDNTLTRIKQEIAVLEKNKQNSKDKVSIQEYSKALQLKLEQADLVEKMELKLERINSYLVNITAALEQTNTYITKVKLKDDNYGLVDESQYLTESLKQITTSWDDIN